MLYCEIVVSEFELRSRYYIHFPTNNLGKDMDSLTPIYALNGITTVLVQGCLQHEITHES